MTNKIVELVSHGLVESSTAFSDDKLVLLDRLIETERNETAKWVLMTIRKNACVADKKKVPSCDDTGIPHLILDVGPNCSVTGQMIESIKEGVKIGLRRLPGRPMAVTGGDIERIEQSLGIDGDPGAVEVAPILIRGIEEERVRLHIMMFGGGPEIRAKTYRVFHRHSLESVIDEIVGWAIESTRLLGCTPSTLAVGVGRSHFEATSMMLQSLVDGRYDIQSDLERTITERVNAAGSAHWVLEAPQLSWQLL